MEDRLRRLEKRDVLTLAAVGKGGITVEDGGSIRILDGAGKVLLTLDGSGLTVSPDGTITVAGSEHVTGDLDVTGDATFGGNVTLTGLLKLLSGNAQSGNYAAGSAGWRLRSNGNVEINDLTLRGGIIGNDALANPISCATFTGSAALSLTFTTSFAAFITKTLAVPAGFTSAVVFATATATGVSGGTTNSALESFTTINGSNGPTVKAGPMAGAAISVAPFSRLVTGLSGGDTITISASIRDGMSPGTQLANLGGCTLSGFAIFLR